MINKMRTAQEAVAGIQDGMTIMVGGFLGTGTPEILIDALVEKGVKHLTVIANDGGLPASVTGTTDRGVAKLLSAGMVDKMIASHVGMNPIIGKGMNEGTLECTLVPQGSLAEKIRAGGYGLGGVLTPTGLGTPVGVGAEDASGTANKESIVIDGKEYLLERPLRADIAFIYGSVADKYGNVKIHGTARNFNTVMATAADTVICQADELVEMIDPDDVLIQGVLVDYIVGGKN